MNSLSNIYDKSLRDLWDMGGDSMSSLFNLQNDYEMYEEGNHLKVKVKVAGYKKDQLSVNIDGDVLHVSGEVKKEEESTDKKNYFKSMSFSSFAKAIKLPYMIKEDSVKAKVEDGMLYISMEKTEHTQKNGVTIE